MIAQARSEAILQVLAICWEPLRKIQSGLQCKAAKRRHNKIGCDTINTGRLHRKFTFLNDHPDRLPPYKQSVKVLLDKIDKSKPLKDMAGLKKAFINRHAESCDMLHVIKQEISQWRESFDGLELESVAPASGPSPPGYLTQAIEAQRLVSNFIEPVMSYVAVNADGQRADYFFEEESAGFDFGFDFEPFIRCSDCPSRLYRQSRMQSHLQERLHMQRRDRRILRHGRDFIPGRVEG